MTGNYDVPIASAQAAISVRRLAMRSLPAYARSTALPTVWARHGSITAWSASVHSPTQDRNELRNPCTVVRPARPALRRMCRTTLTQSPVRD